MARLGRWTHATLTLLWFPLGVLAVLACALFTLWAVALLKGDMTTFVEWNDAAERWQAVSPRRVVLLRCLASLLATWSALAFLCLRKYRPARPGRPGVCARCSYDLTGNVSGVCPECGAEVARVAGELARHS
jgi:hypothetical protein